MNKYDNILVSDLLSANFKQSRHTIWVHFTSLKHQNHYFPYVFCSCSSIRSLKTQWSKAVS